MKALAGTLGALVGLLIVAGFGYVLLHRPAATAAGSAQAAATQPAQPASGPPRPDAPLSAPLSEQDRIRQDLDRKREPYFHYLLQTFGDQVERFWVREDYDTLDVVLHDTSDASLSSFIQRAVAPSAREYGFRRVRIYAHGQDAVHPYSLVAEVTRDDSGQWNIFRE